MYGSFPLGSILGIPVRVHVLLLALIAVLFITGSVGAFEIAGFGMLAVVLVLHELGHCLVARHFGVHVVDITLWPLGGMARMSHMPASARIEGLVASAGPAVNFALAVPGLAGWIALSMTLGSRSLVTQLALYFLLINVVMGVFNLIPAFPTDGGRILRALLARRHDWVSATRTAVWVGRAIAIVLGALGIVFGNWMIPLLALWLWWMGGLELNDVRARARQDALQSTAGAARGFDAADVERMERFRGPLASEQRAD